MARIHFPATIGPAVLALTLGLGAAGPALAQNEADIEVTVGDEVARSSQTPFRTDTVTIRVGSLVEGYGQLEYKITMREGDMVVYSWTSSIPVQYEFHGHSEVPPGEPITDVHWYRRESGDASHGQLVAPVDGLHGWYFLNREVFDAAEIELTLSGYYELTPGVVDLTPPPPEE